MKYEWSEKELKRFFDTYVFGTMKADIQREIEWARSEKDAGNFLSTLGLLFYTEFMGFFKRGNKGNPEECFNDFFDYMGDRYKQFKQEQLRNKVNVYHTFRCGMAYTYFVRENCDIPMLKGSATTGIGILSNGRYYFNVEKYFEDLMVACKRFNKRKLHTLDYGHPST